MRRFGIIADEAYGISSPVLRSIAMEIGKDHKLARQLWATKILDARCLAALIDDPAAVTVEQMERWVSDFDNWAVCDVCCGNLFDRTPYAWTKAAEWCRRDGEFVKRAGFVMMAVLAVHEKSAPDRRFEQFLPLIVGGADDDRNFVRKAVNWALRQIGKRNTALNKKALRTAREIRGMQLPAARWIAADAIRELSSDAVQRRLLKKSRALPAGHGSRRFHEKRVVL